MRLPRFVYHEPGTIKEACALLAQPDAKLLAGGTELLVNLKQRTVVAKSLVNIKQIPRLNYFDYKEGEGLNIGPATILSTLAANLIIKQRFSLLAQAAASVGSPIIPNTATLGGNLCLNSRCFYFNQSHLWKKTHAACYKDGGNVCYVVKGSGHCHALFVADTVPALIALGAEVILADEKGDRKIPLEKFYTGKGEKANILEKGQMMTQIHIPAPLPRSGGVYLKHSLREAVDFAIVGVAAAIALETKKEVCRDARIVLGSVASGPVRVVEAEAAIRGKLVDENTIAEAVRLTLKSVHPIAHLGFSAAYKRKIVETMTKRAIRQAFQHAQEN